MFQLAIDGIFPKKILSSEWVWMCLVNVENVQGIFKSDEGLVWLGSKLVTPSEFPLIPREKNRVTTQAVFFAPKVHAFYYFSDGPSKTPKYLACVYIRYLSPVYHSQKRTFC